MTVSPALQRFAPTYQFSERHSLKIRATPERIYRAIKDVTADEIFLFRTLTWIRRFGRRLPESVLSVPRSTSLLDVATRTTFLILADCLREIVVGTVVSRPANTERPKTPAQLLALNSRPGYAIATMSFEVRSGADQTSTVSTETRIYATDDATRLRFAVYWFVIHAGSAFIRRMWLRAIRDRAEGPEAGL